MNTELPLVKQARHPLFVALRGQDRSHKSGSGAAVGAVSTASFRRRVSQHTEGC